MNYTHPELTNLSTKLFDENKRKKVAELVVNEYNTDKQSCEDWHARQAAWIDLYNQRDITEPPFEGAASESIPMITEACSQLHARAMNAMFHDEKLVRVVPMQAADSVSVERAKRLSKHMQFTVFEKIERYIEAKDALILGVALRGCMFTKTWWDPISQRVRIKNVRPTDLILPYNTGYSSVEDCPRKTEVVHMPIHEAALMYQNGFFAEMPEVYNGGYLNPLDETVDIDIQKRPIESDYVTILEQHRYLDIKGNGSYAPVIAWVDLQSGKLLRLTIRWETDETGIPIRNAEPTEYYTQWNLIPNPDGIYGIGYGQLLGEINRASNRLLRILIDGGVLSTVAGMSGFIDRRLAVAKGDVQLELGKFVSVPSVDNMSDKVWSPPFAGPNPVLIELMKHLTLRGDRMGMVTELVTGQAERAMQPTTVTALLDQSEMVYSVMHVRLMRAWESELRKIFILNSKHMQPQEYFYVMDATPEMQQVSQNDYQRDYQVKVIIEKSTDRKQRLTASELEFNTMMMMPWVQADPVTQWRLVKRRLETIGVDPIEDVLPPIEQVMQTMQAMAQQSEGAAEMASKEKIAEDKNTTAIIKESMGNETAITVANIQANAAKERAKQIGNKRPSKTGSK